MSQGELRRRHLRVIVANVSRAADGEAVRRRRSRWRSPSGRGQRRRSSRIAILAAGRGAGGHADPGTVAVIVTRNYGETANEKANELLFHLGLATLSIVAPGLAGHRLARSHRGGHRHPGHDPAHALCGWIMGYTLNRVSLFALIFSIGILVDDAIVGDREHLAPLGDERRTQPPHAAPSRPWPRSATRRSSRP